MDERLGETARQSLLANPTPAAVAALREAMPRTKGLPKIGVIQALGVRRDVTAVRARSAEANNPDPAIRRAASDALSRIGAGR